MSVSEALWQAHTEIAIACLQHPFVRGIATGTLPSNRFAYYVGQDAFFLEAFARTYSIAAAKAPDWEGFEIFHDLTSGVLEELRLHRQYAQNWGIDLETIEPGTVTRRYTDFLGAIAWQREVGVTAAAMAPCMRLYGFLGREIAKDGIREHQYTNWIETYSGDEFTPLVARLESIVDRYAEDNAMVRSTYRYAMECELDFFEAAWRWGS
ncbi:MAG: TenA family protein [Cyanobacteriota bacterium]|nr:TenA family protein [Cyanobacteriota bacterium]